MDLFQCNHVDILHEIENAVPFTKFDTAVNFVHDIEASLKYKKKMYRVLKPFRFYVGNKADNTWVYVPEGFLSDLASVPKWVERFIPHDGPYAPAAIVHDILCEHATIFKNGEPVFVSYNTAHDIFKEAMGVLKIKWLLKNIIYWSVKVYFWWNGYKVPETIIGKTNDAIEYKWGG